MTSQLWLPPTWLQLYVPEDGSNKKRLWTFYGSVLDLRGLGSIDQISLEVTGLHYEVLEGSVSNLELNFEGAVQNSALGWGDADPDLANTGLDLKFSDPPEAKRGYYIDVNTKKCGPFLRPYIEGNRVTGGTENEVALGLSLAFGVVPK